MAALWPNAYHSKQLIKIIKKSKQQDGLLLITVGKSNGSASLGHWRSQKITVELDLRDSSEVFW